MEASTRDRSRSWVLPAWRHRAGLRVDLLCSSSVVIVCVSSCRMRVGTGTQGTAPISASGTFVCVRRTAIQVLERDRINTPYKSKYINNHGEVPTTGVRGCGWGAAAMCAVSGCVRSGEQRGGDRVLWPVLERQLGSPARGLPRAGADASPRCHCVRTMTATLVRLLPFLSHSFCLARLQSPSGVHQQHVCPPRHGHATSRVPASTTR